MTLFKLLYNALMMVSFWEDGFSMTCTTKVRHTWTHEQFAILHTDPIYHGNNALKSYTVTDASMYSGQLSM